MLLVKLIDVLVHIGLGHPSLVAAVAHHFRHFFDGVRVEALHQFLPFLLIQRRHGVEQDKEAEQQCDHVAIGIHPAGAAAAFIPFHHRNDPFSLENRIILLRCRSVFCCPFRRP